MFLQWHHLGLSRKFLGQQPSKELTLPFILYSVRLNIKFTIYIIPGHCWNLAFSSFFFYYPYQALCISLTCPLFLLRFRKSKTKPNGKKPPAEEKKQYLEPEFTKIRVVDFDLKELVVLPREIDLNEWLASNSEWLWLWWYLMTGYME